MSDVRTVHTFCRICQAACGLLVDVRTDTDGSEHVVKVSGDPDHPLTRGYTCSKGRAAGDQHHHPDRLDHPEMRGAHAPWDVVLDDLGERLRSIIDTHGPDAVAVYRSVAWAFDSTGRFFIDSMARGLRTKQIYSSVTIDTPAKLLVPDLMGGSPYLTPLPDREQLQLLILVGQNPIVSHGHGISWPTALSDFRSMRARGGALVVVDPRTTESAANADLHLAARPGTDAALLAFLVRHALAHRPDAAYLAAVAMPGSIERLTAAVASFDLDTTAVWCDVQRSDLERLAALVTSTPRLAAMCGTGTSMGPTPNVAEWLAWALNAVTGSLDRRGGIVFNPGFLRPQEGGLTSRPRFTGPSATSRPELSHQFGELPCTVLADEIASGSVKALLVFGGNPANVFPDAAKVDGALRSLDVLAVCETRRTATTAVATHVLPGTGQFERADLPAFFDGAFPEVFTQYANRVVAPVAERRPTWWIAAQIGTRLGVGLPSQPDAIGIDADDALLEASCRRSRADFAAIKAAPSGLIAESAPDVGWLIPDGLPNGHLDLAPVEFVTQLAAFANGPRPDGSLVLVNRRLPQQMNSMLSELDPSRPAARSTRPTLLIHPDDADEHDLIEGEPAVVRSAHGETTAVTERSTAMRRGVVSIPHGFGTPEVNRLTSDTVGVDPLTGMPRFSGLAVTVRPA
ncbi:MAG: molybdopterin-dependent oxidoreductase [Acidimicrobiia bacterium]